MSTSDFQYRLCNLASAGSSPALAFKINWLTDPSATFPSRSFISEKLKRANSGCLEFVSSGYFPGSGDRHPSRREIDVPFGPLRDCKSCRDRPPVVDYLLARQATVDGRRLNNTSLLAAGPTGERVGYAIRVAHISLAAGASLVWRIAMIEATKWESLVDLAIADGVSRFGVVRQEFQQAIAANDRGYEAACRKDFPLAIAEFDEALRHHSRYAEALNNRGLARAAKRQFDLALADFDRAIKLKSGFSAAYNNRGMVHHKMGEFHLAISDFDVALKLDSRLAAAYTNRGASRAAQGEFELAVDDFDSAIGLLPSFAPARFNRGFVLSGLGETDAAVVDYTRAVELDEQFALAWFYRGDLWRSKGYYERAISDFDAAIAANRSFLLAYLHRAEAQQARGQARLSRIT